MEKVDYIGLALQYPFRHAKTGRQRRLRQVPLELV